MSDEIKPTEADLEMDLAAHLECLSRFQGDVVYVNGPYSISHHRAAIRRALAAEDDARALREEVARLRAEVSRLRSVEADAAALRLAFNRAAETYPGTHPMGPAVQQWWQGLYNAITSTTAGTGLLAEVAKLQAQVAGHVERIAAASEVLSQAAERSPILALEQWRQEAAEGERRSHDVVHGWNGRIEVRLEARTAAGEYRDVSAVNNPAKPGRDICRHIVYAGTPERLATLSETVAAALARWRELYGEKKGDA